MNSGDSNKSDRKILMWEKIYTNSALTYNDTIAKPKAQAAKILKI